MQDTVPLLPVGQLLYFMGQEYHIFLRFSYTLLLCPQYIGHLVVLWMQIPCPQSCWFFPNHLHWSWCLGAEFRSLLQNIFTPRELFTFVVIITLIILMINSFILYNGMHIFCWNFYYCCSSHTNSKIGRLLPSNYWWDQHGWHIPKCFICIFYY